jgi:hypothetical protein
MQIHAQQPYKSCLDGDMVKWSVLYSELDWPVTSMDIIAYGDTIINEHSYKSIYLSRYFGDLDATNTNWKNYIPELFRNYPYYIRESEDASQLYFLAGNREYLVSDMNLQVGDRFQIPEIWYNYVLQEDISFTVDSVYTKDGLKHVQLDYLLDLSSGYKLTFIEGAGPNIGLISFSNICLSQLLNCFQNQSLFYKSEVSPYPCGYFPLGDDIQIVSKSKDYVLQREKEQIKIHFLENKGRQIAIYDISGRLHYRQNFFSGNEIIISSTLFPKGIYLLKIDSRDNNQINIHKIIL